MADEKNRQNFLENNDQKRTDEQARDITPDKALYAVSVPPPVIFVEWMVRIHQRRQANKLGQSS